MAAIALTIIILLNYLAFYYAYRAFKGSIGTKQKIFFPAKNPVDARREVVTSIWYINTNTGQAASIKTVYNSRDNGVSMGGTLKDVLYQLKKNVTFRRAQKTR